MNDISLNRRTAKALRYQRAGEKLVLDLRNLSEHESTQHSNDGANARRRAQCEKREVKAAAKAARAKV